MRGRTATLNRPTLMPRALGVAGLVALATFASFALSVLSARDAGAQTPAPAATPNATPTGVRTSELAPIEAVEVRVLKSLPAQYEVLATSGLPGGCAAFESISARRAGTRIDVTVRNSMPVGPVACTAIYGYAQNTVNIGSDFVAGTTYTVVVNGSGTQGATKTFTPAAASPVPDPAVTPPPAAPPTLVPRPANVGTGGVVQQGSRAEAPVELIDALVGGGAAAGAAVAAAVAVALLAIRIPRRRGH